MTVRTDVLGAVDAEWRSARDLHRMIGKWSRKTIHHKLRLLAIAGEIETMRVPCPCGVGEMAIFRSLGR